MTFCSLVRNTGHRLGQWVSVGAKNQCLLKNMKVQNFKVPVGIIYVLSVKLYYLT